MLECWIDSFFFLDFFDSLIARVDKGIDPTSYLDCSLVTFSNLLLEHGTKPSIYAVMPQSIANGDVLGVHHRKSHCLEGHFVGSESVDVVVDVLLVILASRGLALDFCLAVLGQGNRLVKILIE